MERYEGWREGEDIGLVWRVRGCLWTVEGSRL